MFGLQLADVSTRCFSHPQGISEARYENAGALRPVHKVTQDLALR